MYIIYMYFDCKHNITAKYVLSITYFTQQKTGYAYAAHAGDVEDVIVVHVWTSRAEMLGVFQSNLRCVRYTRYAALPFTSGKRRWNHCLMNSELLNHMRDIISALKTFAPKMRFQMREVQNV